MDALTFIAEIAKAFAWPVCVVVLAYLLRQPLKSLVLTVRTLRYKEFEADFTKDLERIELKADKAGLPPADELSKLPLAESESLSAKYRRLSWISPRTAILEAWRELELVTRKVATAADYCDVQEDEFPDSSLTVKRLLREGKVDTPSAILFEELGNLRIRAYHAYDTQISAEEAYSFALLAARLAARLEATRAMESPPRLQGVVAARDSQPAAVDGQHPCHTAARTP